MPMENQTGCWDDSRCLALKVPENRKNHLCHFFVFLLQNVREDFEVKHHFIVVSVEVLYLEDFVKEGL
jgi:hypothetical protein